MYAVHIITQAERESTDGAAAAAAAAVVVVVVVILVVVYTCFVHVAVVIKTELSTHAPERHTALVT